MYTYAPTLSSIRRWVEGLERRFARQLAMVRVLPVAKEIVELWDIAIANQQPKPDPLTCISKFTDAGIRLQTFKDVHIYLSPNPPKGWGMADRISDEGRGDRAMGC